MKELEIFLPDCPVWAVDLPSVCPGDPQQHLSNPRKEGDQELDVKEGLQSNWGVEAEIMTNVSSAR